MRTRSLTSLRGSLFPMQLRALASSKGILRGTDSDVNTPAFSRALFIGSVPVCPSETPPAVVVGCRDSGLPLFATPIAVQGGAGAEVGSYSGQAVAVLL